jgi:hypothetical protein
VEKDKCGGLGERSGVGEVDISKGEPGNNEIVVTFIVLTAKENSGSLIGESRSLHDAHVHQFATVLQKWKPAEKEMLCSRGIPFVILQVQGLDLGMRYLGAFQT